jgi:hypothetical protein
MVVPCNQARHLMGASMVYDDGRVRLDDTGITLAHYYFPLATSKHLRYEDIASFRELPMGWLSGRLRGWDPRTLATGCLSTRLVTASAP